MAGKRWGLLVGAALMLTICAAPAAQAGPFIGYWGWFWNPAPDCPHPMYPPLHYWCTTYYKIRMWVNPSYLDQYPAGPIPGECAPVLVLASPCRTVPPTPPLPYGVPQAYFGRPIGTGGLLVPMVPPEMGASVP